MSAQVVVIEDNPANLELMRYLLQKWGYPVLTAMDGESGLELVARHRPDLIVCDIQLPKIDGYELSRILNTMPEESIPRIAVSALAMVGDRDRILASGFHGYISKPIDPLNFVPTLEQFLPAGKRVSDRPASVKGEQAAGDVMPYEGTILAVDDRQTNLDVVRSIVEPNGFRVFTANTTRETLQVLEEREVDLILADFHLDSEPDFQLIERIKRNERYRSIPFVYISATTKRESLRRRGLELGAVRFTFRPIEPAKLLEIVRESIESAGRAAHAG